MQRYFCLVDVRFRKFTESSSRSLVNLWIQILASALAKTSKGQIFVRSVLSRPLQNQSIFLESLGISEQRSNTLRGFEHYFLWVLLRES